jgi:fatty acid desaturase
MTSSSFGSKIRTDSAKRNLPLLAWPLPSIGTTEFQRSRKGWFKTMLWTILLVLLVLWLLGFIGGFGGNLIHLLLLVALVVLVLQLITGRRAVV